MAALPVEKLMSRVDSANKEKQNWVAQYRDAYTYALPMRNLYETVQSGADKMNRVFDSTAITATQKFAARLTSNLTPPYQHWLDFLPGTEVPEDRQEEAKKMLQKIQKIFFGVIENSNFDSAIAEFYLDLAVGTGVMLVLEGDDDNPVIFTAVPNAQVSLDEGPMGSIDGVFRQYSIAPRNIEATWPDITPEGKTLIQDLINPSGNKENNARISLLESTYFDFDEKVFWYQVHTVGSGQSANATTPTDSSPIDRTASVLLVERRLNESPWVIARWVKVAGEVFGRGPLLFAMPDIKTLNKTIEFMLQNASMSITGLWAVENDAMANLDMVTLAAGTFLPLDNIDKIKRLDIPGDFRVGEAVAERMINNIRAIMFDRGLPDPAGAVRSPTEIIERVRELAQDIGAPFARINSEMLQPLASRVLNILNRKAILDFPIKLDGRTVKVLPTSLLAKEQNINDLQSAVQWLQLAQSLGPDMFFNGVKVEDFPAWSAEKLGIDQELVREKGERQKIQEMVAQIIAQTKLAEAGKSVA